MVHPSGNLAGIPITGWQGTLSHSESQTPYQICAVWWGWSDGVSWEVLTAKLVIVVIHWFMLVLYTWVYKKCEMVYNTADWWYRTAKSWKWDLTSNRLTAGRTGLDDMDNEKGNSRYEQRTAKAGNESSECTTKFWLTVGEQASAMWTWGNIWENGHQIYQKEEMLFIRGVQ